jgi:hypothetical protein
VKAITIRGVDPEVAEKLKSTAKDQGKSINQLSLELIKASLGLEKEKQYSRQYTDLDDLFGRWNDDEFAEINARISQGRQIDPELWK